MNPVKQPLSILISLLHLVIACNKCQKLTSGNEPQPWNSNLEKQVTDINSII